MISLESFKMQVKLHLYYYEIDDYAIIDAYNHLTEDDKIMHTNLLGIDIFINETNQIFDKEIKLIKQNPTIQSYCIFIIIYTSNNQFIMGDNNDNSLNNR